MLCKQYNILENKTESPLHFSVADSQGMHLVAISVVIVVKYGRFYDPYSNLKNSQLCIT